MDRVRLLNRVDTKLAFNVQKLPLILQELSQYYHILDVNGIRLAAYDSIYFDTPQLHLYQRHHNGIKNRYKVRYRKYVDSDLSFFEVKLKSNKGRTDKRRVKTDDIFPFFDEKAQDLMENLPQVEANKLEHSLQIFFSRITLADKNFKERATIDVGLSYETPDGIKKSYENLVIAELKQERMNRQSPMLRILKKHHILPARLSKYCVGVSSCFSGIKTNNFKKKLKK